MNKWNYLGLTAVAVICAGPTPPPVGYLVKLGPAPLRFQAPSKRPEEIVPLPPLAMADPEPPPTAEILGPPSTNSVAATPVQTEVEPPVQSVSPTATPVVEAPVMYSPQMLIQYFNEKNGTNHDGTSVVVPYQFNPPPMQNIPAPPSRATYIVK